MSTSARWAAWMRFDRRKNAHQQFLRAREYSCSNSLARSACTPARCASGSVHHQRAADMNPSRTIRVRCFADPCVVVLNAVERQCAGVRVSLVTGGVRSAMPSEIYMHTQSGNVARCRLASDAVTFAGRGSAASDAPTSPWSCTGRLRNALVRSGPPEGWDVFFGMSV